MSKQYSPISSFAIMALCFLTPLLPSANAQSAVANTVPVPNTAAIKKAVPNPAQPEIQVLIMRDPFGRDMVDLTYPGVVPAGEAQKDVLSIIGSGSTGNVEISNEALPLHGATPVPMTSATFEANGVTPAANESTFRLEPLIVALKNHKTLAITYIMPAQFAFNGLRQWQDKHVTIALDQRASTFTYRVHIIDSNFDRLGIPLMQPDPRTVELAQIEHKKSLFRVVGLVLVSALAAAVGYAVYTLLSRLQ